LNLYVPTGRSAFSYRASFDTEKDRWVEIEIPMQQFQATSFGRPVANRPLRPEQVTGIGILLSDKQPGPFRLAIDWIKVVSDGT